MADSCPRCRQWAQALSFHESLRCGSQSPKGTALPHPDMQCRVFILRWADSGMQQPQMPASAQAGVGMTWLLSSNKNMYFCTSVGSPLTGSSLLSGREQVRHFFVSYSIENRTNNKDVAKDYRTSSESVTCLVRSKYETRHP